MRIIYNYLLVVFIAAAISCGDSFPTSKQKEEYNSIRERIIQSGPIQVTTVKADSARMVLRDVIEYELETFIDKYKLKSDELDAVLFSMNITAEILETKHKLDTQFKEAMLELEKQKKALAGQMEGDSFTFQKMDSLKFSPVDYLNVGDSTQVNVVTFEYDSTVTNSPLKWHIPMKPWYKP